MSMQMALGRVIADIAGTSLSATERELLINPQVGGVILFARNFSSAAQLAELTAEIHALRCPQLLIAVDHEGGRVQRFRDGFTAIPPMRHLGSIWDQDRNAALGAARNCGFIIAAELRACGVDLSFTPVLDLDHGPSGVIGNRAFHRDAAAVAALAGALVQGLRDGGMAACGKHFPGHGYIAADSHVDAPIDERTLAEMEADDLVPFRRLVSAGLAAIMPAHVVYPKVDASPAGFSARWLRYLRHDLGFNGIVFSDDLSMEGAKVFGGTVARGLAAVQAGCDMVLLCNQPDELHELVTGFGKAGMSPVLTERVATLFRPSSASTLAALARDESYRQAVQQVNGIASGRG